jgi:uncharacterized protein YjiS (DUF1127 family)
MSCAFTKTAIGKPPVTRSVWADYPLVAGLLSLWASCCWLHERQRQRQALLELDDRLLDDIGVTREQALATGRKRFWQ